MSGRKLPGIVVLASGNGSNFQRIVEASRQGILRAYVKMLIVDKDCYAVERAKRLGIPFKKLEKPWRENLKKLLGEIKPDFVVLAGFMRILPPDIVKEWANKIVNIHPSLLPSFPGKDAIKQTYEYGVKVTGITIHIVDEGVDTGPIVFQRAIEIDQSWDLETLESKIHEIEHENYPKVIDRLLHEKWRIEGRKFEWI